MRDRRPLVLSNSGAIQQLQRPDDVDAPIADKVDWLECQVKALAEMLARQGVEVPPELLE